MLSSQETDTEGKVALSISKGPMRIGLVVALVLLFPVVFVALQSARRGWSELHPPKTRPQKPGDFVDLLDVTLTTSDGVRVAGWYVPSRNGATILLVHGFSSNREQMVPAARLLAEKGYGVLMIDLRAHGASDGSVCTWGDGERNDVVAALDFLSQRPEVDTQRIGGLGVSLGASVLTLVGAEDRRLSALVLEAMPSSLEDGAELDPPRWGFISAWPGLAVFRAVGVNLEAIRPIEALRAVASRQVFLIYGKDDPWVPLEMRVRMVKVGGQAWVASCSHADCVEQMPQEYAERVIAFFGGALK